jgi:hypothetical protein
MVIAHEMGHVLFSLVDEYGGFTNPSGIGPYCGHTIMNGPDQANAICVAFNHCLDPAYNYAHQQYYQPPNSGRCLAGTDGWTIVQSRNFLPFSALPVNPSTTSADQWNVLQANERFLSSVSVTGG